MIIAGVVAVACISHTESYLRERAVKLKSDRGTCSGEQVRAPSGVSYILTAAHCALLAKDGQITVETEDGKTLSRRVIAEDPESDLLLLEGLPGVWGLDIADSAGRSVRTFTSGKGMHTYKTEGYLVQVKNVQVPLSMIETDEQAAACTTKPKFKAVAIETFFGSIRVCVLDVAEMVTTAPIVPGSSGGMVVNDAGELVGVVSAGDGFFGYLVTLSDIKKFIHNY